jgi:hypothetical protein
MKENVSSNIMLPTIKIENLFDSDEIDHLNRLILNVGTLDIDDGIYSDSASGTPGQHMADYIYWDYHKCLDIESILTHKLEKNLNLKMLVQDSHILESCSPYKIHADFIQAHSGSGNFQGYDPAYTIIIPMDTYDSMTVCFNEWLEDCNDFEIFKKNYQGEKTLKIDPKFCAARLSHLHPLDLAYLSIQNTFSWTKGSMFAMDRRYIHCSDNFPKRKINQKRAIVLFTVKNNEENR